MTEQERAFLKEYGELCRKYRVFIGACGCCRSPWITTEEEAKKYDPQFDPIAVNLEHLADAD